MNQLLLNQSPIPRTGGFQMADYWVWCPSVIQDDSGRFHMFASRWPKWLPFHPGWQTNSEVVRAVADQPEGPYEFQEVVLPARGAEYWDGRATHNPRIVRGPDGFLLFYTGITHPFPDLQPGDSLAVHDARYLVTQASKRVGLAMAPTLAGPWRRLDRPILETKPGTFYSFLTSNPAPVVHADGSAYLMFKSKRYIGNAASDMLIGAAVAEHYAGEYRAVSDRPIFGPEQFGVIEDPFVWCRDGNYHMIAKDMEGTLCGEHHGGLYAVSRDGIQWELGSPKQAYTRAVTWDDGQTQTLGQMERASVLFANGQPRCLFAAVGDGPGGFHNMTRSWNVAIPLKS